MIVADAALDNGLESEQDDSRSPLSRERLLEILLEIDQRLTRLELRSAGERSAA